MNPYLGLALASLGFGLAVATVVVGLARALDPGSVLPRKVFHVAVFSGAVPAHLILGFWGAVTYGFVLASLVMAVVVGRDRFPLYGSLARFSGGERARPLIVEPLIATGVGALAGASLVGELAVVGYLVCGWGDALGELVGRRFGRHPYRPLFRGSSSRTRSWEGSLAVFLAGTVGAGVGLSLLGFRLPEVVAAALACGLVGAVAEAVSSPGTDNFWVQLLPSLTAWWILV